MANLEEQILRRYGVDIRQIQLLKLYHLDKPDAEHLTANQLEEIFLKRRSLWQKALNNPNEKVSGPARQHLEAASRYEAILRDGELRKELEQYYSHGQRERGGAVDNAQQFFGLVSQTKRLTKNDAEFYYDYFPEERRRKKAINEMLKKQFKVRGLGGREEEGPEQPEKPEKSEKSEKSEKRPAPKANMVVNLFRRETLLALKRCEGFYSAAAGNGQVCRLYPALADSSSLYDFLQLDQCRQLQSFGDFVSRSRQQMQRLRTEFGTGFTPLVDLFNTLDDLMGERDVVCNFPEFKLLLKYPLLSPYMYEFEALKPKTLEAFYALAEQSYEFDSLNHFILDYFQPIYDNFGIYDNGLRAMLRQAQKGAQASRLRRGLAEKLGALLHLPGGIRLAHFLTYWPIFLVYFLFELLKAFMANLRKLAVVGAVLFTVIWGVQMYLAGNLSEVIYDAQWVTGHGFWSGVDLLLCLVLWALVPAILLGIVAGVVYLIWRYAVGINKSVDWIGMERTLQQLLIKCRNAGNAKRAAKAARKSAREGQS